MNQVISSMIQNAIATKGVELMDAANERMEERQALMLRAMATLTDDQRTTMTAREKNEYIREFAAQGL